MKDMSGKTEAYIRGYQILIERGMSASDIDTLDDYLVAGTFETEEYCAGRMKGHKNDVIITESGERKLGPDYEGYVYESYG